jgi:hypothetical protein
MMREPRGKEGCASFALPEWGAASTLFRSSCQACDLPGEGMLQLRHAHARALEAWVMSGTSCWESALVPYSAGKCGFKVNTYIEHVLGIA